MFDFSIVPNSCLKLSFNHGIIQSKIQNLKSKIPSVFYFTRVARFKLPTSMSRTFLLRQNSRIGVP